MDLKILYEDATLLVLDKPTGLSVLREGSEQKEVLADLLKAQYPELEQLGEEYRYGIVHRLDKNTSGVLLVAKTKEMFTWLQSQFQERQVEKRYQCLVAGNVKKNEDVIHTTVGRAPSDRRKQKAYAITESVPGARREATTEYRILKRFQDYTLLELFPKTGRKHQIRAHMVFLGHPIAGDALYAFKNQQTPPGLMRQFLHATFLRIMMPDGKEKSFESPLAQDLQHTLQALEKQQ